MAGRTQIDRNTMRGGAGVSALALLIAFALDVSIVAPIVGVALVIGAVFGLRASPLGVIFRALTSALRLKIAIEREDESPPRFAQAVGAVFLAASTAAFIADATTLGWTLALIVAALQTLLAVTGICVGCEMYLLGKRLTSRVGERSAAA